MISISIVTYNNTFSEVEECITRFISSELISSLVICENTESPLLNEGDLKSISGKIKYVSNTTNTGYGAGHNLAISNLNEDTIYHVVMNLDVEVQSSVFKTLFAFMEKNPNIIQVMPKVLNTDGTIQRLCKRLPTPMNLIGRRFMGNSNLARKIDGVYTLNGYEYNSVLDCPYLSGCFMFLRKKEFGIINGFDEQFFMYPEDIDLTRRLHEIGRTVCNPCVSIIHAHGQASYKSKKMLIIHMKGIIKYFNKWGWIWDKKRTKFNNELSDRIDTIKTHR
jgi:hypothetical protein